MRTKSSLLRRNIFSLSIAIVWLLCAAMAHADDPPVIPVTWPEDDLCEDFGLTYPMGQVSMAINPVPDPITGEHLPAIVYRGLTGLVYAYMKAVTYGDHTWDPELVEGSNMGSLARFNVSLAFKRDGTPACVYSDEEGGGGPGDPERWDLIYKERIQEGIWDSSIIDSRIGICTDKEDCEEYRIDDVQLSFSWDGENDIPFVAYSARSEHHEPPGEGRFRIVRYAEGNTYGSSWDLHEIFPFGPYMGVSTGDCRVNVSLDMDRTQLLSQQPVILFEICLGDDFCVYRAADQSIEELSGRPACLALDPQNQYQAWIYCERNGGTLRCLLAESGGGWTSVEVPEDFGNASIDCLRIDANVTPSEKLLVGYYGEIQTGQVFRYDNTTWCETANAGSGVYDNEGIPYSLGLSSGMPFIETDASLSVKVRYMPRIIVNVYDDDTGEPIENVDVFAISQPGGEEFYQNWSRFNDYKNFDLDKHSYHYLVDMPPGEYMVTVSKNNDYSSELFSVTLGTCDTYTRNVWLAPKSGCGAPPSERGDSPSSSAFR